MDQPRKELQGPRPTPLKVRKESHKIKKPPIVPPGVPPQQLLPPQQPSQPVIIYTASPKVIHANPNDFMTLVQRLTGPDATSSMAHHHGISGAMSPVSRFGSIEMTKMPLEGMKLGGTSGVMEGQLMEISDSSNTNRVYFPGILSPGPGLIPPISPNLFSPLFHDYPTYGGAFSSFNNYNDVNLHHGSSGVQQHGGSSSYIEGSNYMISPISSNNNFISPGAVISPTSLDLLHQILNG